MKLKNAVVGKEVILKVSGRRGVIASVSTDGWVYVKPKQNPASDCIDVAEPKQSDFGCHHITQLKVALRKPEYQWLPISEAPDVTELLCAYEKKPNQWVVRVGIRSVATKSWYLMGGATWIPTHFQLINKPKFTTFTTLPDQGTINKECNEKCVSK